VTVAIQPLEREHLPAARGLFGAIFPGGEVVAEEKLFGASPAPLMGWSLGVWADGRLAGLAAGAGRWLRLLAVDPACREQGLGGQLVHEALARGVTRIGDQPGNYVVPGIDERSARTLEFFEKRGFRWRGAAANLTVELVGNPLLERQTPAWVRRATAGDAAIVAGLAQALSPAWAFEAARALQGGAVWLAEREGQAVAFACTNGNNQGLGHFGPAGTRQGHRGQGLGRALLIAALRERAAAGQVRAIIAWVGPDGFYERSCGARPDAHFVLMERA
jgi:GNAT superfamily N-acetyltransferase